MKLVEHMYFIGASFVPIAASFPLCDDRYNVFRSDKDLDTSEWNEDFLIEYMNWLEETSPKFCKDCGIFLDDIVETDDVIAVDKDSGDLIYGDNHPCNPDSPLYD